MSSRNDKKGKKKLKNQWRKRIGEDTIAFLDKEIEHVMIAVIGEFVVGGRQSLEALSGNCRKVAGELSVLSQHHRAPRHETVYKRFLTHLLPRRVNSGAAETGSNQWEASTFFALLLPHHFSGTPFGLFLCREERISRNVVVLASLPAQPKQGWAKLSWVLGNSLLRHTDSPSAPIFIYLLNFKIKLKAKSKFQISNFNLQSLVYTKWR